MTGWLVVNPFLRSPKFDDLYALIDDAFRARGATLERIPSTVLARPLGTPLGSPDFVIFWDKDSALARRLEDEGLRVFNPSSAIAICDSKIQTALALSRLSVPMPHTIMAPMTFEGIPRSTDFLRSAADVLGFPFVIKEEFGSFGQQVHLVRSVHEAESLVAGLGHRGFVMQRFIASSAGCDMRVNVVGGVVICAMRRFSANGDFRSNVTLGGRCEPAVPTPSQRRIAMAAAVAAGADFAGVDLLCGPDGEPLVCEVNSNPHFRSTLDCTGVNLADAIADHVLRQSSTRSKAPPPSPDSPASPASTARCT